MYIEGQSVRRLPLKILKRLLAGTPLKPQNYVKLIKLCIANMTLTQVYRDLLWQQLCVMLNDSGNKANEKFYFYPLYHHFAQIFQPIRHL